MAPPTINRATIMITIGFEKPVSASDGVRIPSNTSDTREHSATISDRIFPQTNSAAVIKRTIKTVDIIVT